MHVVISSESYEMEKRARLYWKKEPDTGSVVIRYVHIISVKSSTDVQEIFR